MSLACCYTCQRLRGPVMHWQSALSALNRLAAASSVCLGDDHITTLQLAIKGAAQATSGACMAQPWPFVHGLISGQTLQQPPELQRDIESPHCSCLSDKLPLQSAAALPVDVSSQGTFRALLTGCSHNASPGQAPTALLIFIPHTTCRETATPGTWPPSRQLPLLPAPHSHHPQVLFVVRHGWPHHVGQGLPAWLWQNLQYVPAGRGRHQPVPIVWPG